MAAASANYGSLTAVNTTIAYDQAGFASIGGGLYDGPPGTTTLYNTIVAANTAYDGPDDIAGAGVSSASAYNLVGVDETGSLTNGTDGNQVIGTTNPGLGLLASNGGPSQTIALLAGSPAIDAGSNALANDYALTTDQRGAGFPRIVNGVVDIGAFERPLAASIGPATVYTVDLTTDTGASTGADAGDLAYVIGQANLKPNLAGSVIQFDPTVFSASNPKTITLTSTLELGEPSGPMVIDGPGAGVVTISGGNAVGVFQAEPGAVTTLSGLTISGGSATNGGGIDVPYDGTMTVVDCTITANTAGSEGGGIDVADGGTLTLLECIVSGNTAGYGGGIFSYGTLTLTGSTVEGNTGSLAGGIFADSPAVTISGSTIANNTGNGIFNSNGGAATITDSTIEDNTTTAPGCCGGGAGIDNNGTVTVTGSTINDNTAGGIGGEGGGIFNDGTLTLSG